MVVFSLMVVASVHGYHAYMDTVVFFECELSEYDIS